MSELKLCPICKREHEIDVDNEFGVMFRHKNFDFEIDFCLLAEQELPDDLTVDQFVEVWNTRPIEDQLRAENERLKVALNNIFLTDVVEFVHANYHGEYPVEFAVMNLQEIARQALKDGE